MNLSGMSEPEEAADCAGKACTIGSFFRVSNEPGADQTSDPGVIIFQGHPDIHGHFL